MRITPQLPKKTSPLSQMVYISIRKRTLGILMQDQSHVKCKTTLEFNVKRIQICQGGHKLQHPPAMPNLASAVTNPSSAPKYCIQIPKHLSQNKLRKKNCTSDLIRPGRKKKPDVSCMPYLPTYVTLPSNANTNISGFNPCNSQSKHGCQQNHHQITLGLQMWRKININKYSMKLIQYLNCASLHLRCSQSRVASMSHGITLMRVTSLLQKVYKSGCLK